MNRPYPAPGTVVAVEPRGPYHRVVVARDADPKVPRVYWLDRPTWDALAAAAKGPDLVVTARVVCRDDALALADDPTTLYADAYSPLALIRRLRASLNPDSEDYRLRQVQLQARRVK